jgi:hypothetical protein
MEKLRETRVIHHHSFKVHFQSFIYSLIAAPTELGLCSQRTGEREISAILITWARSGWTSLIRMDELDHEGLK